MSKNDPDILYFKLTSGEEIVGEVVTNTSSYLEIKNIIQVIMVQNGEGSVGIQFMPFAAITATETPLRLYRHSIAVEGVPSQEFMNNYNQKYGSGIQVVDGFAANQILHS